MKNFIVLIMFTIIFSVAVGCGNQASDNEQGAVEVSLEEMLTKIKEQIASDMKENGVDDDVLVDGQLQSYIEVNLLEDDDSFFSEKLNIDEEQIKSGYLLAAMMNVNSDQLILLEASDAAHVESLKEMLEKEKEAQIQTWQQYLPGQYEKVQNNIIKVNGNYLLYVTYSDSKKIEEIFDLHFE